MNSTALEKIFKTRINACKDLLLSKGIEYAPKDDRLKNFYDGAELLGCTPKQYALALVTKHIIALKDHINTNNPLSDAFIDEKISDIINYMILIEAINYEGLDYEIESDVL